MDYNPDVREYLRKRRLIEDPYEAMRIPEPERDPIDPSRYVSTPVRDPIDPEKYTPKGFKYEEPKTDATPAMTAYKEGLGKEPQLADYKPSRTRNILSRLAGGFVGAGNGGRAGAALQHGLMYEPYNKQQNIYKQQQGQRSALAGLEASEAQRKTEAELQTAKIGELTQRAEAERQRGLGEAHKATAYVPTDEESFIRSKQAGFRPLADSTFYNSELGQLITAPKTANGSPINAGRVSAPTVQTVGQPLGPIHRQQKAEDTKVAQDFTKKLHDDTIGAANARSAASIEAGDRRQANSLDFRATEPTGSMRSQASAAKVVVDQLPAVRSALAKASDKTGPFAGRWNDILQGKIGMEDPDFMTLRSAMDFMNSGVVRAHVGARGGKEVTERFDKLGAISHQSPENMLAYINEAEKWMRGYAEEGISPRATQMGGGTPNTAPAAPKATSRYNPATGLIEPIK